MTTNPWKSVQRALTALTSAGKAKIDKLKRKASGKSIPTLGSASVVAAAIRDHDGSVHQVPKPGRHHDVIRLMVSAGHPKPITGVQGFVLSDGRFVEREEAKQIATAAGQLLARASKSRSLFSEDVW